MGAIHSKRYKICWNCNGKEAAFECSQCTRLFHRDCLARGELISKRNWICVICTKLAETTDKEKELKVLPTLITRVKNDKLFKRMLDVLKNASTDMDRTKVYAAESILKAIDLLQSKDIYTIYNSFDGFLVDVQWILSNYSNIIGDDTNKSDTINLLQQFIEEEIDGLKKCGECYMNANNFPDSWFTMVCDEPHIIAWAKIQGFRYWPVKVMSVNGRTLSVRFFGDHKHADVSASKCFLYSIDSPGKPCKSQSYAYKLAMNETNSYISNIRQLYGSFNYARVKTEFDPMLMSKYSFQMIPRSVRTKRRASVPNLMDIQHTSRSRQNSLPLLNDQDGDNIQNMSPIDLTHSDSIEDFEILETNNHESSTDLQDVFPKKRVRFADEMEIEYTESGEQNLATSIDENCTTRLMNMSIKTNPQNSSHQIDKLHVLRENARLKQQLKELNDRNAELVVQLDEMKNERIRDTEQFKIEKKLLIIQIKRLEDNHSKLIEESKTKQFCFGCGITKTRNTFYFCDIRCQKLFCEQLVKSK